jgi:hypothetical protein
MKTTLVLLITLLIPIVFFMKNKEYHLSQGGVLAVRMREFNFPSI